MFHIAAFFESIGAVTNEDITPVQDQVLAIQNSHFMPQNDMQLVFAAGFTTTLLRVRLNTPRLNQITLPFIRPLGTAVLPTTDPNVADYRSNPLRLAGREEIAMEATTSGVGPQNFTGLIGLQTGFDPAPRGDIYTIRGASTTAAVVNVWTDITVTWANQLPAGRYECVGGEVQSTNGQAFRFLFENQYWRPGGISVASATNRTHQMFRNGGLGSWGRFDSTRMPGVQVLANVADAAHDVYLDFVRVG